MTVLSVDKKPHLLLISSGSHGKKKQSRFAQPENKCCHLDRSKHFYNRIKAAGITELNIEGIAEVYDYLVLVNRGTAAKLQNHLIITKADFLKNQEKANLQTILIDFENVNPGKQKLGVSGLRYSDKHEDLFITLSEETEPGQDQPEKAISA